MTADHEIFKSSTIIYNKTKTKINSKMISLIYKLQMISTIWYFYNANILFKHDLNSRYR